MATVARPGQKKTDQTTRELGTDVVKMAIAYARQETVDPLKALVRYLIWGLIGALLFSIGIVLVVLAVVRALQAEFDHHLNGSLVWVPYVGGILFAVVVVVLFVTRVAKVSK